MSTKNVVVCYPVTDADTTKIRQAIKDYRIIVSSQQSIAADLFEADIFCGHAKVVVDWESVVKHGRLKWIQSSAAGLDHCLVPSVIDSNIIVSGCSGLFANQVAEQTAALLFALIRRLPVFFAAQQKREYVRRPTDTLHHKTVAIIGFGGNGRRIAELLKGIAGKIIVTDTFDSFQIPEYVTALPASQSDAAFAVADVVIVTLPLTDPTFQCISEKQFSLMKPESYFINMARGGVVNQDDLVDALKNGRLSFAGLDVVDPEPLPADNELWKMDNVIITPHVGAQAESRVPLTTELFCQNYQRFASQQTLINQVDKDLGFPRPQYRLMMDAAEGIKLPAELM